MLTPGFINTTCLCHPRLLRTALLVPLLAVFSALAGCISLPKLDPLPAPSQALTLSPQTPLGRLALASMQALAAPALAASGAANPDVADPAPRMSDGSAQDLSGLRLLPLGTHALDARLQLVHRAQRSLDLQYYHFADDSTGRSLLRALRDAAARGVRVRVLDREPDSQWWMRCLGHLLQPLAPEDHL